MCIAISNKVKYIVSTKSMYALYCAMILPHITVNCNTFSSFEKVSQLTVKECILSSAPSHVNLTPSLPSS